MNFLNWIERKFETKDDMLFKKADVAIAIGIDVSGDGTQSSPFSKAVALKAMSIVQSGKAQNLLLTGGYSIDSLSEAETMANDIAGRLPVTKIFLETESYRTYANADCTLKLMKQYGWKSAIIVAQQWHARRVRATFKKRWHGSGIQFAVIKAHSRYGGGSQKRLNNFLYFLLWDTLAYIVSKLKSYC